MTDIDVVLNSSKIVLKKKNNKKFGILTMIILYFN